MRPPIAIVFLLACMPARAELTCEQFGAIADETVRQRNQGASLRRLLADVDRGDMKSLPAREIALVKDVIQHSFNGTLSPPEVVEACRQGGTIVPGR